MDVLCEKVIVVGNVVPFPYVNIIFPLPGQYPSRASIFTCHTAELVDPNHLKTFQIVWSTRAWCLNLKHNVTHLFSILTLGPDLQRHSYAWSRAGVRRMVHGWYSNDFSQMLWHAVSFSRWAYYNERHMHAGGHYTFLLVQKLNVVCMHILISRLETFFSILML